MDEPTTPDEHEPTDQEIADAADREAKDAAARARADKKTPPPARRGPGRPPGAKNRKPGESEARARGAATATATAPTRKSTPPRAALPASGGSQDDADRAARQAQREARKRRVAELTTQAKEMRPDFVTGVGMLSGLPAEFLVQPRIMNGQPVIDGDTGEPVRDLTVYGQALAPKDWQLKMCAQTYARIEETDIGERFADAVDKWAPYLLMVGAVGAVGMYAFTAMQTAAALRPMIADEIQKMAAAQQAAAAQQQADEAAQGSPAGERPAA